MTRTMPWPPNFQQFEFDRNGLSPIPAHHLERVKGLGWILQGLRQYVFDNRPVTITNAYRTPEDFKRLKDAGYHPALNSYHNDGLAVDFIVHGLSPREVQRRLRAHGWPGGLGLGATFTHIDLGPKRSFNY